MESHVLFVCLHVCMSCSNLMGLQHAVDFSQAVEGTRVFRKVREADRKKIVLPLAENRTGLMFDMFIGGCFGHVLDDVGGILEEFSVDLWGISVDLRFEALHEN